MLLLLLPALALAAPACTHIEAPPRATSLLLCTTVWPSSQPPTTANTTTITWTATAGLFLSPGSTPTINSLDVSPTFTHSNTAYSFTYTTQPGDELWPWTGLALLFSLSDGAGLALLVAATITPGSPVRNVQATAMPTLGNQGEGVCMADIDGDEDVDVFVLGSQLWVNDGDGGFTNVASTAGISGSGSGCAFADVDNDGSMDLFNAVYNGVNKLYLNDGTGAFMEAGEAFGVNLGGTSTAGVFGDVDGDGFVDLFVSFSNAANVLHMNVGGVGFQAAPNAGGTDDTGAAQTAVMFDADADGDLDIGVSNHKQGNKLYVNDGAGQFSIPATGFATGGPKYGITYGDVNNDGALDVYVCTSVKDTLLLGSPGGTFATSPTDNIPGVSSTVSNDAAFVDFEMDGDLDVLIPTYVEYALLNDGGAGTAFTLHLATTELGIAGNTAQSLACGVLSAASGYPTCVAPPRVYAFGAPGVDAPWIGIRPVTPAGAPSAFGAIVRLTAPATGWAATRVMENANGMRSQNAYDAVFGLADASAVHVATVDWMGGTPRASGATHPVLSALPLRQVVIVRPSLPVAPRISPWDTAGTTVRFGQGTGLPPPNSTLTLTIPVGGGYTHDLVVVTATVDGVDVLPTFNPATFSLSHTPPSTTWPWDGVFVNVTMVDGAGLGGSFAGVVVPGSTFGSTELPVGGPMCWGDVDGDGDMDAMSLPTLYLAQDGTLVPTPAYTVPALDPAPCSLVDITADGYLDVVVPPGKALVFDPAASAFVSVDLAHGAVWGHGAFADFNGDGAMDAFGGDSTTVFYTQMFTQAEDFGTPPPEHFALLDVDGDTCVGVLVTHTDAAPSLIVNTGGVFSSEAATRGLTTPIPAVAALSVGDFNNDAHPDVFLALASAADVVLVSTGGSFLPPANLPWYTGGATSAAAADVDLDGDLDVYVGVAGGGNVLFLNDGSGTGFLNFAGDFGVAGVGDDVYAQDADGDGDVDLLVCDGSSTTVHVGHGVVSGATARTVIVQPLAVTGARVEPGATVTIASGGGWSASVFTSPSTPWARFASGDPTSPHTITITWPNARFPPSTTSSHPFLAVTPAASPPLTTLRGSPATVTLHPVSPWEWDDAGSPSPGASITIPFSTSVHIAPDNALTALVGGVDVSAYLATTGGVGYTVTATPPPSWPWAGFPVNITLVDYHTVSTAVTHATPGVTLTPAPTVNATGASGACFGRVHGAPAVYVTVDGGPNRLFTQVGDGFADTAAALGVAGDPTSTSTGCAFGAANVDGLPALYVTQSGAEDRVYLATDGGAFVETTFTFPALPADDAVAVFFDVFADVGAFVCVAGGDNHLYVKNTASTFASRTDALGLVSNHNCVAAAPLDATSSGRTDVVVANFGGPLQLFIQAPNGVFGELVTLPGSTALPTFTHALGVAVEDVNGDTFPDIALATTTSSTLFLNDGAAAFSTVALPASASVAALDVDADGDLDIVLEAVVYVGLEGVFVEGPAFALASPRAFTAHGDLDGDGDIDVVTPEGTFLSNALHPTHGTSVVIRPLAGGASFGAVAFGALTTITCVEGCGAPYTATRRASSTSAYDAAFFGLPTGTVYNATVAMAGGVYSHATHPSLGAIHPALHPTIVIRPWVTTLTPTYTAPFVDAGTPVTVAFSVSPHTPQDASITATFNGVPVTLSQPSPTSLSTTYAVHDGDPLWPWEGLHVHITMVDSGGVVSSLVDILVIGSAFTASAALPPTAADASNFGVCLADVNGDGVDEVFIARTGALNTFWVLGGGTYADEAASWGVAGNTSHASEGCAFGDVDGDGDVDLFVGSGTHSLTLFINTAGVFVEEGAVRGAGGAPPAPVVTLGDVDADGDLDAVLSPANGVLVLLLNNGTGWFAGPTPITATTLAGRQAVLFDADGDTRLDVGLAVYGAPDALFINSGAAAFDNEAAARGFDQGGNHVGLSVGDVYGSGCLDAVIITDGGSSVVLENNCAGVFSAAAIAGDSPAAGVALVDPHNDGLLAALVGVSSGGVKLYATSRNGAFLDAATVFGLGSPDPTTTVACGDVDGDGDSDCVSGQSGVLYLGSAASTPVVVVRALTAAGAPSAFGATATLHCGESYAAARYVDGGSGWGSQGGYNAVFGVAAVRGPCTIRVAFPSGAVIGPGADPSLSNIHPASLTPANRTFTVSDGPYVEEVRGEYTPPGGVTLAANDTVSLRVVAGLAAAGLQPAPGCCFVNGVQVQDTFKGLGGGVYALTYVLGEGDGEWLPGQLQVVVPLSAAVGVSPSTPLTVPGSPAGDPIPPVISFDCQPPAVTASTVSHLCIAARGEAAAVSFSYTVSVNGGAAEAFTVPPSNMSSPASATLLLGPHLDGSSVAVAVTGVDAAGNAGSAAAAWKVDETPPETKILTRPPAVTASADAEFQLGCTDTQCSFAYVLDGAPPVALGGDNETAGGADGGGSAAIDTVLVVSPRPLSNTTSTAFQLRAVEGVRHDNTTVVVSVDGAPSSTLTTNASGHAEVVHLLDLSDGRHAIHGVGVGGDGARDGTPLEYIFTVDTVAPMVHVLAAPADGEAAADPTVVVTASEAEVVYRWRSGPAGDVDGAAWRETQVGVLAVPGVAGGRAHTVQVFSVDGAGNAGQVVNHTWTPFLVDCPAAVPAVSGRGTAVGLGARFIEVVDPPPAWALFEAQVDSGPWEAMGGASVVVAGLELGEEHVVGVRAGVPAGCDVVVGAHRPAAGEVAWVEPHPEATHVEFVAMPPASTPNQFAGFGFETAREHVVLEYRLDDDVAWTPCGLEVSVGPLTPGGHSLAVRGAGADGTVGTPSTYAWTVTASSASSVVLGGLPDGTHTLVVTATDDAGNVEASPRAHEWRVDTTPPTAAVALATPPLSRAAHAAINVSCVGEVDPCTFCWGSVQVGGGCANHTSVLEFVVGDDGVVVVQVWAVDSVLHASPQQAVAWEVDTTPPVASFVDVAGALIAPPPHLTHVDGVLADAAVELRLTADETVSGWYYVAIDGFTQPGLPGVVDATSALLLAALPEAVPLLVNATATDVAGNVGQPSMLRFVVDTLDPQDTSVGVPPSPHASPNVTLAVSAADNPGGSGIAAIEVVLGGETARVDGASGAATFTGLPSGVYNVSAVGVDVVGHQDMTPATAQVVVDIDAPVSTFAVWPPPFLNTSTLVLVLGANEAGVSSAAVDGGVWVEADGGGVAVVDGLGDGEHVVWARSVDVAGNVEAPPYVEAGVVVDTVAPAVVVTTAPQASTADPTVRLCFAVNDSSPTNVSVAASRGVVSVDAGCARVVVDGDGGVTASLTPVDAAGNVGHAVAVGWVLDREAPVTAPLGAVHGCNTVGDVTVCSAAHTPSITPVCVPGGGAGTVAPCFLEYAVVDVDGAGAAACVGGRRLLLEGFTSTPSGGVVPVVVDGDGLYNVVIVAVDEAGNVEAGNVTLAWYVDTEAPVSAPTLVQTPDKVVSSTTALFLVQLPGDASPGQTLFWYELDDAGGVKVGEEPSPNTAAVQLEVDVDVGSHKVKVWAVDQGGNAGPSVLYDWLVVDSAPLVNITRFPAPVSGVASPPFEFVAQWPSGGVEPNASIQVDLVDDFQVVCEDTVGSGGVCAWNASLAATGPRVYTLTARTLFAGVTGDPNVFTWEYKLCGDEEFAEVGGDGGISCVGCPVGGNCEGGLTAQADIAAVRGFWAPEGSSGLRFYECPVAEACLPGGEVAVGNETVSVVGRCREGYTGTLCAVCEDGFFEQFGLCARCDTGSGVAWLVLLAVVVALVTAGVVFFKFRDLMPIDQLKVTLSMVQIIASANTAYDIPWPPLFADFLNSMRVFLIEAVSLTRANCAQPMTFYGSLAVTLVGFKVVLAVIVLGPVAVHKWKQRGRRVLSRGGGGGVGRQRRRRSSVVRVISAAADAVQAVDWAKVFKITFLFLFVAYPGVSLKIMKTFKCVEVEGDFWLVADMRLKCYEGDWYGYALYAFVMGCVYTGGLPLAITVILWRQRRRLGEDGVVGKWGFLYETYGVGAYLWEVVELLRKLWLSALVVLMAEGSPLQVTVAVLISGWAHVLHAVYKPWRGVGGSGTYVYVLQHGSLFVTCFVFLMGLLFKVEGVSQDGTTYNVLAWAMLLACVVFLVAAAVLMGHAILETARGKASRRRPNSKPPASAVSAPRSTHLNAKVVAPPTHIRAAAAAMTWVGNPISARARRKSEATSKRVP